MSGSALGRLRARLNRGDSWLTYDVGRLFARDGLDDAAIDELETRLVAADAGVDAAQFLAGRLRLRVRQGRIGDAAALTGALKAALLELLAPCAQPLRIGAARPFVILTVGVNGAGKTTTVGKLAARLRGEGRSVMLAAGDTFRAAAGAQLGAWAERSGARLAPAQGGDPAAVIYDAIAAARAQRAEVLIADTAGRLHTQGHLMDELRKIKRVMQKHDAAAPHEVLLVLDGTTGGNALKQVQEFHQALGVTGLVLTKLDGTAKGGTLLAIARTFKLPIRFIGVGEAMEDLLPFDANDYVDALLS